LTLAIAALIAAAYRRTHRQPPHASPVPVSSFHRVGLDRGKIAEPITPALERIERDVVPCPSASPVQRDEIDRTASDIKFRKSLNERGPLRQIARLQRRQPNCPSVGEMLAPELSEACVRSDLNEDITVCFAEPPQRRQNVSWPTDMLSPVPRPRVRFRRDRNVRRCGKELSLHFSMLNGGGERLELLEQAAM